MSGNCFGMTGIKTDTRKGVGEKIPQKLFCTRNDVEDEMIDRLDKELAERREKRKVRVKKI